MGGWEQKKVGSEVKAAEEYLKILKKNNLSCTIFINGKCFENEGAEKLLNYNVELGGHTYDNFGKMNLLKSYKNRKLFNCIYGSSNFQKKDIKKTKKSFERFGLKMISWRTHCFGSNEKTFKLLENVGVKYISDLLGEKPPFKKGEVIHLPINIPVDQNTIIYGKLGPSNRDPFASCTKGRVSPEEWFEILKKRVKNNENEGIASIVLIHPSTMAALDNFRLFKKIALFLSKYESKKISEIIL
tara:strand:- start:562 stop:1290 length:729 start_codon:yes stop_codon:yes gene_type:complete